MANNYYWCIALTGGTAGCLDAIDGAGLTDKDIARVIVPGDATYTYALDADSGLAESSPDIIAPDTNAGNKRWILLPAESARGLPYDEAYKAYLVTRK